VKQRLARIGSVRLDPGLPVCVGLFLGDHNLTHATYGANRACDAMRHAARIRATGVVVSARWVNIGAWNRELWVCDLSRPLGMHPEEHYGVRLSDVRSKAA
jgi:SLT domain-containing protein